MTHSYKKIFHNFTNARAHFITFTSLMCAALILSGAFFLTRGNTPYTSELAFTEQSILGKHAGSVIPASCESGVDHGATQGCWDGSVISSCSSCSARPTTTCWNGAVITPSLGESCPAYPPVPSVSASISPTHISYGGSFNSMSYTSSNAVSCNYGYLSYTWGVNGPYYGNQTWTFICYNAISQSSQQSVTLNVCPASAPTWNGSICVPLPTVTLNPFSPSTIITGNSSSFSYSSTDATTCSGFGVVSGNLGSTGTTVSTPVMNTPGTYTQSVTCTGPSGSVTSQNRALVVDGPASLIPGGAGSDSGLTGFNVSPRSVDRGGLVKLTWGIHYPNNQCKIVAAVQIPATCNATCQSDRATASTTLNSILTSGTTNANDPYGASRNMTTALTTKVPSTQYARGEKSVTLDYSTTFTLSCGTGSNTFTPVRSIIYVTDRTEG